MLSGSMLDLIPQVGDLDAAVLLLGQEISAQVAHIISEGRDRGDRSVDVVAEVGLGVPVDHLILNTFQC